jgi:hypothetical protein
MLSDLVIDEVAFCDRGMNPRADMVLWKAKPKAASKLAIKRVRKDEHDDPGTFGDHFEDARAMEIDAALDRRLHALLAATTEIMRADDVDREPLILEAVNDYAAAMNRDVPDLFAGRLAKMLSEWAKHADSFPDVPRDDRDIHAIVKAELELAGLAGELKKGETMDWLKTLTKEERNALDFALGGTDPAEFFKGTTEAAGLFVVALTKRAVAATTSEASLATAVDELTKARASGNTDEGFDAILKSITDPAARELVTIQRSRLVTQGGEISELKKAEKRRGYADIVKTLGALPNENGALVTILEKADAAGILDDLKKVLAGANAQAEMGKAFHEIGGDTLPGEGDPGTAAEADEALMAKAVELKKTWPDLTAEQLYVKASELNPRLYQVASGSGAQN